MIFTLIIFVISVITLVLMWRVKKLELATGRSHSVLDLTEIDERIIYMWKGMVSHVRMVIVPKFYRAFHEKLVNLENKVISLFSKYLHKLGHIADVVRGKDLPKNRGSVSFYWQHLDSMK